MDNTLDKTVDQQLLDGQQKINATLAANKEAVSENAKATAANEANVKTLQVELSDAKKQLADAQAKLQSATKDIETLKQVHLSGVSGKKSANSDKPEYMEDVKLERDGDTYSEAFTKALRSRDIAASLSKLYDHQKKHLWALEQRHSTERKQFNNDTYVSSINPAGGYVVLPDRIAQPITRIFENSDIESISNRQVGVSNRAIQLIDQHLPVPVYWSSEGDSLKRETERADLGQKTIPYAIQHAHVNLSIFLRDDSSIDIQSWINQKINTALSISANRAYVLGTEIENPVYTNSNIRPKGFMNETDYPAREKDAGGKIIKDMKKIETFEGPSSGDFTWQLLSAFRNRLQNAYQANATWIMNQNTWGLIEAFASTTGQPLYNPSIVKNGPEGMTLFGRPVHISVDMPDVGTNTLPIAYGDMRRAYTVYSRADLMMSIDNISDPGLVQTTYIRRLTGEATNTDAIIRFKTQQAPQDNLASFFIPNNKLQTNVVTEEAPKATAKTTKGGK